MVKNVVPYHQVRVLVRQVPRAAGVLQSLLFADGQGRHQNLWNKKSVALIH